MMFDMETYIDVSSIPDCFLCKLKDEIDNTCGEGYDYTYENYYSYIIMLYRWSEIFKEMCKKHIDIMGDILEKYNTLQWDEVTIFDSKVAELMIQKGIMDRGEPINPYEMNR